MEHIEDFPLDRYLGAEDRLLVRRRMKVSDVSAGTVLFDSDSCQGVLLVVRGVVRVYMVSESGREITLYRLRDGDLCTLSLSCLRGTMPVQAIVAADTDCRIALLPTDAFAALQERNAGVRELMFETMNERLAEVMWVVDQVTFRGMDRRVGDYLLSRPSPVVYATHEEIAGELGTAREVVSRMLKYFEKNGYIELSRGKLKVIDPEGLRRSLS